MMPADRRDTTASARYRLAVGSATCDVISVRCREPFARYHASVVMHHRYSDTHYLPE